MLAPVGQPPDKCFPVGATGARYDAAASPAGSLRTRVGSPSDKRHEPAHISQPSCYWIEFLFSKQQVALLTKTLDLLLFRTVMITGKH